MSGFDDWLTSNGKCRETASDMDEIQWLRQERQRLRKSVLSDAEREAIDWFASYGDGVPGRHAATLRGLLERTR